jgi:hypothetical protein
MLQGFLIHMTAAAPASEPTTGGNGDLPSTYYANEHTADGPCGKKRAISDVWKSIYRLTAVGIAFFRQSLKLKENSKDEPTHVCRAIKEDGAPCNTPLRLHRNNKNGKPGTFITTPAVEHIKEFHTLTSVSSLRSTTH